jgi:hypothetical protein
MKKLEIGDRVRFLNTVGGGVVKGFINKQLVMVEDEHGFDLPVLITECVPVVTTEEQKPKTTQPKQTSPPPEVKVEPKKKDEETPEGEQITACLAYLPTDVKQLTTTTYECYFVNDSNYYLFFNYMCRENNTWRSRYNGIIEPNTKIFLEEFEKAALNELEKVAVQFIAFKQEKSYKFKNPCSVELRIDTVKFYKLHSFRENDYFEDDALIYYIIQKDLPERELLISAGDLERAMKEKEAADRRPRIQRIEKKAKNIPIEVDLHANALLDTTSGMSNADLLEYQLNQFHEAMRKEIHHKGQKIVFIHGKGDGILRNAILKELKSKYPTCYYQDASFQEYGYGATMVTIK